MNDTIDVFDFTLADDKFDALDRGVRGGPDPNEVDPSTWDLEGPNPEPASIARNTGTYASSTVLAASNA